MSDAFAPIAEALRRELLRFYDERGEALAGTAGENTLDTNSRFVTRRAEPLLEMLRAAAGIDEIAGLRLVDAGAGFGALSLLFASRGASVVAIDPNEQRFEVGRAVAAEFGLDVTFVRGRMQRLPLEAESFDLAVLNNSLCYVVPHAERRAALAEALRVLRPGGWLVARNPNRLHPRDQFTGLPLLALAGPDQAVRWAERLGRRRSHVRLTSPRAGRRELREAGFVEVRHAGLPGRPAKNLLKAVARYHHLLGRRPPRAEAPAQR